LGGAPTQTRQLRIKSTVPHLSRIAWKTWIPTRGNRDVKASPPLLFFFQKLVHFALHTWTPRVISFAIWRFKRKCLAIFQKRNILWHTSYQPQYTAYSMLFLAVPEFINQSSHVANTYLSTLPGHKSCERLGVESRLAKSQTAIHAVRGQLQRLLSDVMLWQHMRFHENNSMYCGTVGWAQKLNGRVRSRAGSHWREPYQCGVLGLVVLSNRM